MSKHEEDVFVNDASNSLEPISTTAVQGLLCIEVQDQLEDGTIWLHEDDRYVVVSDVHGTCHRHKITLREHVGSKQQILTLSHGLYTVYEEVDDTFELQYYVNGKLCKSKHVEIEVCEHQQTLVIIRKKKASALVDIRVVDEIEDDVSLCLHHESGMNYPIVFQDKRVETLCLPFGCYEVTWNQENFTTVFDGNALQQFVVCGKQHELCIVPNTCGNSLTITLANASCVDVDSVCLQLCGHDVSQQIQLDHYQSFCVRLFDLCPQEYQLFEAFEHAQYALSFRVNGGMEESKACFCIANGEDVEVEVNITPREDEAFDLMTPLKIQKMIRHCDGMICLPQPEEEFFVLVEGCGLKETFVLNEGNNFSVELADVCIGRYVVKELGCQDYVTTYQVNDDIERTSACIDVKEGCKHVVTIINEVKNKGNVRIGLYIETDNKELVKPQSDEMYEGSLRSWASKDEFVLDEANDWCVYISDLSFGSYEVKGFSDCAYDVSYVVNGVRQKSARFYIEDCMQNEIRIIWTPRCMQSGILKISKYEQTKQKQLVKPSANERFMVDVCSEHFHEQYVLHQGNRWCVTLEGLPFETYRITECETDGYHVSYIVNQEWCEEATVHMGMDDQEVIIVNERKCSGVLTVSLTKQNSQEESICPQPDEYFDIVVEGVQVVKHIRLQQSNDWCVSLHDLPMGQYRIIQQEDYGYHVSYCVNGETELFGRITLTEQDCCVQVVNKEVVYHRQVYVQAYVQQNDGSLCLPSQDMEIPFVLYGNDVQIEEVLCAQHGFSFCFNDLVDGEYEIEALCTQRFLCYRVLGRTCDYARFRLSKEDMQIDLIYMQEEVGMLTIDRKICQGSQYFQPSYDNSYEVSVKADGFYEVFALYEGNDFCVTLHNMPLQRYEIKALHSDHVCYEVNGYRQHHGFVELGCGETFVRVVEEETLKGCMELCAWFMVDDKRCRPSDTHCFELFIQSESYHRKLVLDQYNDFCITLYDLPSGHYEITSLDKQFMCSFEIHGILQECAAVDLYDQDVCIALLYEEVRGCLHFQGILKEDDQQVSGTQEVYRLVISGEKQYEIQLDQQNHFQASLCGLTPGCYQITEVGKDTIHFEIDGQVFQNFVQVEVCQEDVCVDVVRSRQTSHTLMLQHWVSDANQQKVAPTMDAVFEAELKGENSSQQLRFSKENNFTQTLENMPDGMYDLIGDNIRVQVEDGSLEESGRFHLHQDLHVNLVQFDDAQALLRIRCRIESDDQLQLPEDEDSFTIQLTQDTSQLLTFNKENGYRQKVLLKPQPFELLVIEASGTLKGYQYDGQFTTDGMFSMPDEGLSITCIFTKDMPTSQLTLQRVVRNPQCDCLQQPSLQTNATIHISNGEKSSQVILHQQNGWKAQLDCPQGMYHIEEVGNSNIQYMVDGEIVSSGKVALQNDAHTVMLVEERMEKGSIDLCRLIKDENGKYVYPSNDEEYWITLRHKGEEERILLNAANHYYVSVRNLEDGWYDIVDEQQQAIGYIVNHASMTPEGRVHVMQNQNTVNIICDCQREKGSITLAKYVRHNGSLQRPKEGESFVFRVSKENYNRLFTLNEANGWMLTISDLDDGMYVVCETAGCDRVTYMVNGGSEVDYAVVCVQGNSHTVEIINEESQTPHLHMEKFVRVNGQLQKPSQDFVAHMQLTKSGFQQCYELNADNDWSIDVDHLEKGMYVLSELNQQDVTYRINGNEEVSDGIITIQESDVSVMIINTMHQQSGSIRLEKYIQYEDGTTQLPSEDFAMQVRVCKSGFNEVVTLDASNQWVYELTGLTPGQYVVDELDVDHPVTFIVDDNSQKDWAIVDVNNDTHTVKILNMMEEAGDNTLQVSKRIVDTQGTQQLPSDDEQFTVVIASENDTQTLILTKDNQWQQNVQLQPNTTYTIEEQVNGEYEVSYIVDDQIESSSAEIYTSGGMQSVVVLNRKSNGVGNRLEINKFMKQASGTLIRPADGDEYEILIEGEEIERSVMLNGGNGFHVIESNLPDGMYRVSEIANGMYATTYRIDQGEEVMQEQVLLSNQSSVSVDVLNERLDNQNTIDVFKYMLESNGNYVSPNEDEVFSFRIISDTIDQIYELNAQNSWRATLTNYPSGMYRVEEVGSPYRVQYLVNGATLLDEAVFEASPNKTNIIGIINYRSSSETGTLRLQKKMRIQGELQDPQQDSFVIHIIGENYDKYVVLDEENGYQAEVMNLAFGTYELYEENAQDRVSWQFNDEMERADGVIDILDTQVQNVTIINTRDQDEQQQASRQDSIRIIM